MSELDLTLRASHLFSDRINPQTDVVSTAVFLVDAVDGAGKRGEYKLIAMDEHDYGAWQLEQIHPPVEDEDEASPGNPLLVKEEEKIAAGGLVEFIRTRYLSPEDPSKVNLIRDFLEAAGGRN